MAGRRGYGASGVVSRRDLRPKPLTPLQVAGATVVRNAGTIAFDAFRARAGLREVTAFRVASALLESGLIHLGPTRELVWGPAPGEDR